MRIYELTEAYYTKGQDNLRHDAANLSEEEQIKLVSKNPSNLVCIRDPSEAVQIAAVKKSPVSIVYIKFPTEEVQLISVEKNADNIEYIQNPAESVQSLALSKNGANLLNIKNRLRKKIVDNNKVSIIKSILTLMKGSDFEDQDDMLGMIKILGRYRVDWPELDTIKKSLIADKILKQRIRESNRTLIRPINDCSEHEQIQRTTEDPTKLFQIKNPSEKVQLATVKICPRAIRYIENPSNSVQIFVGNIMNKKKKRIIKDLLRTIKHNDYSGSNRHGVLVPRNLQDYYKEQFIEDIELYMSILSKCNLEWPELAIIKNSIAADLTLK